MNKCKGCEWYGKPYWSIINPCDNCPRENTNVEILTRWQDSTIEELKKQLQQKENIIKEVREYCDREIGNIIAYFDYVDTKDLENIRKILDKGDKGE